MTTTPNSLAVEKPGDGGKIQTDWGEYTLFLMKQITLQPGGKQDSRGFEVRSTSLSPELLLPRLRGICGEYVVQQFLS